VRDALTKISELADDELQVLNGSKGWICSPPRLQLERRIRQRRRPSLLRTLGVMAEGARDLLARAQASAARLGLL
jgi:hypothetical protein